MYPHTSLNSSKENSSNCSELRNCGEEEILEGTISQGVTAVKRFKVKRNGELKDTNTFFFIFNTPILPKTVKVTYQIPSVVIIDKNMDTMRIGVLKTLSVLNADEQLNTSKIDVETSYTVLTVVKNTVLTLNNAKFGTKKKKSYVLSSPETFLSLKCRNLLKSLLQLLESVMPTLPSLSGVCG